MRERAWRDKWKDPLEKAADKILESDRVNTYQKNKRAVLAALKEKALTDEEARDALKLSLEHIMHLRELAAGTVKASKKRNVGTELAALKILLEASGQAAKQQEGGNVGVNVVVNTYRKDGYELPKEGTTPVLPEGKEPPF